MFFRSLFSRTDLAKENAGFSPRKGAHTPIESATPSPLKL